jgi:hypothetical protein
MLFCIVYQVPCPQKTRVDNGRSHAPQPIEPATPDKLFIDSARKKTGKLIDEVSS